MAKNGMNDARGQRRSEKKFYEREAQRRKHKYHDTDVLRWDGLKLRLKTGRLLATVEDDPEWVGMYRVRLPSGYVTDMANLSRAKDAARALAMASLNSDVRQSPSGGPQARSFREAAE